MVGESQAVMRGRQEPMAIEWQRRVQVSGTHSSAWAVMVPPCCGSLAGLRGTRPRGALKAFAAPR